MLLVTTFLYLATTFAHAQTPECPPDSKTPECVKKKDEHPKPTVQVSGGFGRHPRLMPVKKAPAPDKTESQPAPPPPPAAPPPPADGDSSSTTPPNPLTPLPLPVTPKSLDQSPEHKDGLEPDLSISLSSMKKKDTWPIVNYIGFEWGLRGETPDHREKVWGQGSLETRLPLAGPGYYGGKVPAAELSFDFTALTQEPKLHPNTRVSVMHVIMERDQNNGIIYDGHVYLVGASYAHEFDLPFMKAFISLNPSLAGYRVLHVINEGVINAAGIAQGSFETGATKDFFHEKLETTFAVGMSGDLSYGRRPIVGQSNFFGNTTRYWRVELGKKGANYSFEFSEETSTWHGISVLPDSGFRGGVNFDAAKLLAKLHQKK